MNIALRKPRMSRDEFFPWAQAQEVRYEFDGFEPVAMTGGTVNHDRITVNLIAALRVRLRGSGCRPGGSNAGVATIGDAVRYPDALVSCTNTPGTAHLVAEPVVAFEVLSPTSGRIDRIDKVREYAAVPSIHRYVIVESTDVGATVLERASGQAAWTATALTAEDTLHMPEIGIEIPIFELYEDTDLLRAEERAG